VLSFTVFTKAKSAFNEAISAAKFVLRGVELALALKGTAKERPKKSTGKRNLKGAFLKAIANCLSEAFNAIELASSNWSAETLDCFIGLRLLM
jgi:hypothetical protein